MSVSSYKICLVLCLVFLPFSSCIEPITTGLSVAIGALVSSVYYGIYIKMPWQEKCGQKWNNFTATDLDSNLKKHLFGQHLVASTVTNAVRAHIMRKEPKKALSMAFHGWTGGGKNFVAKILADTLYEEGSKSDFVHWYIATRDFPHAEDTKKYRERLLREIAEYTKKCGQSLFIFDEVDKMHPGLIDGLKPFLDFYEDIDGIDYRRNIFVFLSNAGGSEITKVALNFWLEGKEREDIVMKDIEPLVNKGAFNEKG
ncbi:torsin-1A [Parasteatoda tepidariorum]|uniref:torsin-1A n=1 Tax=Parasteatoda tepidariorum TaxID=114398 RepID=UPI001C720591|nr:torsin-1A [Parasteatoda tepidariorum]